jgi:hypothetical protein
MTKSSDAYRRDLVSTPWSSIETSANDGRVPYIYINENVNVFEPHWRLTFTFSKYDISVMFMKEGLAWYGTKTMWH